MTTTKTIQPPFPRLGELYRAMAVALGTKDGNSHVDELARRGDFDWSLLPNLADDLFIKPLTKYVDEEFAEFVRPWFDDMHASYVGMVSNFAIESLTREEALPILIEHYFVPHGLNLIYAIHRTLGGPDPMMFLDPDRYPVAVVMEWLEAGGGDSLARLAYGPPTNDIVKNETEKCRRWSKGLDLPDVQSIVRLAAALKETGALPERMITQVRRWLLIARAVAHLERASSMPIRNAMRRHLLMGMRDSDILKPLEAAVAPSLVRFAVSFELGESLDELLLHTSSKEPGDQARTKADLDKLEGTLAEMPGDGRFQGRVEWLRARWHMLSAEFESALPHYEAAVQCSTYRAGQKLRRIVEEALVLAAHLGKKPSLKRLKHLGIVYGLFADPREDVVEEWEVDQFRQQFAVLFPPSGRFPEASSDESVMHPFLLLSREAIEGKEPDLRNPDRVFTVRAADGQTRRYAQLRFFAIDERYDAIAALLGAGASVDDLDQSGASALLIAIGRAAQSGNLRVVNMLLRHPHSLEALNSVTKKKRLTPLFNAIDLGEPHVVHGLLSMGAKADLRADVIDQTPLYYALGKLAIVTRPQVLRTVLQNSFSSVPDKTLREVFRRYNVSLAGAFGDAPGIQNLREIPRYGATFNRLVDAMVADQLRRLSLPKVMRIIELLLEHGAQPNARHERPEPGRTPLMLAAESDCEDAFDLMQRYGGDPLATDDAGMDCLRLALGFGSAKIAARLAGFGR